MKEVRERERERERQTDREKCGRWDVLLRTLSFAKIIQRRCQTEQNNFHWWKDNETCNRIFLEILIFPKEIPRILCSPEVHCRVKKIPYRPTRVYFTPSHPFFKTVLYFHLSLCLPGVVYPLCLRTKFLSSPMHATCSAHFTSLIWSGHQFWVRWWNDAYREKPKYAQKMWCSANLFNTIPTWANLGSNLGPRSNRPTTNSLNHSTS